MVIRSLKSINEQYRQPYENRLYERILCYEFYHQLPMRVDKLYWPFILHGELDKRYRNIKRIPDFVFHVPRSEKNLAAIEFKSTRAGIRGIKEDLKKLREFTHGELNYKIGILIVFGKKNSLKRLQQKLNNEPYDDKLLIIFFDIEKGKCNILKLNAYTKNQ